MLRLSVSVVESPEEFHPRALPDPCVNLSIHTAPDVRPLWLCFVHGLLPLPDGFSSPVASAEQPAPSLRSHYRTFITTTGCSVPVLRIGILVLAVLAA